MSHKLLFIFLSLIILTSCQEVPQQSEAEHQAELDSFSRAKYGESEAEHVKKMTDSVIASALIDTVGLYKAPVKIIRARMVKQDYSNYRNVYLSYKNVSGKTIQGIKFMWYGTNAFNEPADLGNVVAKGFGSGFTDDELKAGRSSNGTWNILSSDGKKIKLAWPTEVSFTDGTTWKIK